MRDRSFQNIAIGATLLTAFFAISAIAQTVTGTIDMSVRVVILPTAPTSLTASTVSATRIDLTWTDTSSNETGFKIESKIGTAGTYSEIDSVGVNATSYAATTLSPSTTYYFRVRAFNNDGTSAYSNEASSTTAAAPPPPPPSNGGGGGGGAGGSTPPSAPYTPFAQTLSVNVAGYAYPLSKIKILLDGTLMTSATADSNAQFTASVDATTGVHTFGVYSVDTRGRRSPVFTFTLSLNSGTIAGVSVVFLAPILEVDKSEVRRGDAMNISGQTAPASVVTITVHSDEVIEKTVTSDVNGNYAYALDTSALAFGTHTVKTQAALTSDFVSPDSQIVTFSVGSKNVSKMIPGDITHDGRVNMKDFSILLYNWGRKTETALQASDFNHDGKVDLRDMSILLYHWTG